MVTGVGRSLGAETTPTGRPVTRDATEVGVADRARGRTTGHMGGHMTTTTSAAGEETKGGTRDLIATTTTIIVTTPPTTTTTGTATGGALTRGQGPDQGQSAECRVRPDNV